MGKKNSELIEKLKELVPDSELKRQRSIYVEDTLWLTFKKVCEAHGYSASEVVEGMIRKFVEDDQGK